MLTHAQRILPLILLLVSASVPATGEPDWQDRLRQDIEAIDDESPGRMGVHIRHLDGNHRVDHNSRRDWYLASTIKVPLAITVLQLAEEGELDPDQALELQRSDYVDGSGELLWKEPGERFTVTELNDRSVRDSDSTATDMLIRHIGQTAFNDHVREHMGVDGFGPITTILQVRHEAYGEIHPDAAGLSNMDFIDLKTVNSDGERYRMILEKLGIDASDAHVGSTREAFERYYRTGMNSGSLVAFGDLLEKLIDGELINDNRRAWLLDVMENITTGDKRITAGLPDQAVFAHKTGTQVARACDIGVLNPRQRDQAVIVAACMEDFDRLDEADRAFRQLGEALDRAGLAHTE